MGNIGSTPYQTDFYAWANEQAALLRQGRLSEADIANIAEEIESMGKTEKRELASRLTVLLAHLLKWRHQPGRRGPSWEVTITNQRRDLTILLKDNPSLGANAPEAVEYAYANARGEAYAETGLPKTTFPPDAPWSFDQIMDQDFWPNDAP